MTKNLWLSSNLHSKQNKVVYDDAADWYYPDGYECGADGPVCTGAPAFFFGYVMGHYDF